MRVTTGCSTATPIEVDLGSRPPRNCTVHGVATRRAARCRTAGYQPAGAGESPAAVLPVAGELGSRGRPGAALGQQALAVLAAPRPVFQVEHPADGIDHELGVNRVQI